ncbi:hypothetical protein T484DRAFT_1845058 [Baffinella frigidus]|nr:hypothetical protein T484DRAFT_1845058 [Cryptophyta sp. CCMP2293]
MLAQIVLTVLLLTLFISAGTVVWECLAHLFVSVCAYETLDSFRFKVVVLGHDLGWMFGGVIMAKWVTIICQLCRQDSPEVQNMVGFLAFIVYRVGFLAFIVYMVQSRVFSPLLDPPDAEPAIVKSLEDLFDIRTLQRYAPHYFFAVYTATTSRDRVHYHHHLQIATTSRWCFSVVRQLAVRAMRVATLVESRLAID